MTQVLHPLLPDESGDTRTPGDARVTGEVHSQNQPAGPSPPDTKADKSEKDSEIRIPTGSPNDKDQDTGWEVAPGCQEASAGYEGPPDFCTYSEGPQRTSKYLYCDGRTDTPAFASRSLPGLGEAMDVIREDPAETSVFLPDRDNMEECPICTEMYDNTTHRQSLLNCNHVFCDKCIKTIVSTANRANLCRVTCPMCRQTTPVLEWEIRKMQEHMMDNVGHYNQPVLLGPEPVARRPGLCGALEYRFQKRFQNDPRFLFPPCFRYPISFINRLGGVERRCRWLYRCILALLLLVEMLSFFLVFLPIVVFVLLILFVR